MIDPCVRLRSVLLAAGAIGEEELRAADESRGDGEVSLDTAILEMELLDEDAVVSFLVEATGYPPAPAELLRSAGPDVATFPRHWAERMYATPCRLGARGVELVANHEVDDERLQRLRELVQVPLALYAAPEFRVREAFARVYGTALEARAAALVHRFGLGGDPPIVRGSPEERAAGRLEEASSRDEILGALRELLQARFDFGEVYVVRGDSAVAAGARAPLIPLHEPSLLAHAVSGGLAYRGPVPRGNAALLATLGRSAPQEVCLLPLTLGGRVVCVLWGESTDAPLPAESRLVDAVVPRAERALTRLLIAGRRRQEV